MGKKYRLLFVMSIISFVVSALCIVGAIAAVVFANKAVLSDDFDVLDIILIFFGLTKSVVFVIVAVIASIAAAINILLGILGIVCCKQHGRCSLGCLIMGGILSLIAVKNIAAGIDVVSFLVLAHFGLYTAGAAIAYIDTRNDKKERIENNNPYPF